MTKKMMLIIIGAIFLLIIIIFQSCEQEKRDTNWELILKQNKNAYNDTLKTYKSKLGTYLSETSTLIEEIGNLKLYSQNLQNKVDSLKKVKPDSDIMAATEIGLNIKGLTGGSTNTKFNLIGENGLFEWNFNIKENGFSRYLSGNTKCKMTIFNDSTINVTPGITTIVIDEYNIDIFIYTVVNQDSSITIIAETPNDNVTIKQLKHVIDPIIIRETVDKYFPIIEKDVNINWGFQIGCGLNPYRITNPEDGSFTPILYVGVGINFEFGNLISFNIPKWLF